ncbi:cystatin-2-like [Engystomops pustulosus]|uniref:cystatin-2-like n=1 Tax=Engystomops pustulosus TaxID=76066 RepID=UPI003AFB7031
MMPAGLCSRVLVALSLLSFYVYGAILVGGLHDEDPSDPEVVQNVNFAINEFNQRSNGEYYYKLLKIVSAQYQVVAGIRYVLNVEVGRTDCKKASTIEESSCHDSELTKTFFCTFSVLEVPWESSKTLLSSSCKVQQ